MQTELRSLILASAPVAALVARRVDWTRNKQGAASPRIVLHLISAPRSYHAKGVDGLFQDRVQLDIWAKTAGSRLAVWQAVETLLSGYRGTQGDIAFRGIFFDAGRETGGEAQDGGVYLFRRQIDFMVNWKRIET
jgi:hypothetical protein